MPLQKRVSGPLAIAKASPSAHLVIHKRSTEFDCKRKVRDNIFVVVFVVFVVFVVVVVFVFVVVVVVAAAVVIRSSPSEKGQYDMFLNRFLV